MLLALHCCTVFLQLREHPQTKAFLDAPAPPCCRVVLPRLELASYHLAIVQADVVGPGPRRNAAAPLLLQPLLVLPRPAADELQQLWEGVCGLLAPASAGAKLPIPLGAARQCVT